MTTLEEITKNNRIHSEKMIEILNLFEGASAGWTISVLTYAIENVNSYAILKMPKGTAKETTQDS